MAIWVNINMFISEKRHERVKAKAPSFERLSVEIGKAYIKYVNKFSQICDRYKQAPFQNLKIVL